MVQYMNLKQLQDRLKQIESRINSRGIDDFLGLSPSQMHIIFYERLEDSRSIVRFNEAFDQSLLETVPVVQRVRLLLKLIGEAGEAKATQKGYLPKKIVNALYDNPFSDRSFTVPSEGYVLDVLALRHAVTKCGWLRKKNEKFTLTKSGRRIFESGFTTSNYVTLLKHWIKGYNWSFADGYPECALVQQASVFLLYILHKRASELFPSASCGDLFIKAFPMVLEGLPEGPVLPSTPERTVARIIRLRFLERFAKYFGLIDYVVDLNLSFLERDDNSQVRVTELFHAVFSWPSSCHLTR